MYSWKYIALLTTFVLALGLASGLFAGARLATGGKPVSSPPATQPSTPAAPAPERLEDSELLDRLQQVPYADHSEELNRLEAEKAALQTQLSAVLRWILDNVRGRFPLDENLITHLELPATDAEGLLSPEVIAMLKITPVEQEEVNDIFTYIAAIMGEAEAALLRADQPREGKVVLRIPPYQEEGHLLREDLYAALETSLGRPRFERFLDVTETHLQEHFHQFGQAARTIIFELGPQGENGQPLVVIRDGWIQDDDSGVRTIKAEEMIVDELPDKYATFQDFLPTARYQN